jgi:benzoylformate decarboxylase
VVLAGDAGLRYEALDAQMAADLVAMARPVTKWAARVTHPESVLRMLRRATKVAATPPCGPVFLALPMDVLDADTTEAVRPTVLPDTRVAPSAATVARIADLLARARQPLLLAGDGVAASGGERALAELADLAAVPVWGGDWAEANLSQRHPMFAGLLGHMFGSASTPVLSAADVVVICGTSVLPEVFPDLDGVFGESATVVHIDLDAWEIGKNHPVDVAVQADPALTLAAVARQLAATLTQEQRDRIESRRRQVSPLPAGSEDDGGDAPLEAFVDQLAQRAGDRLVVFDESITASPRLQQRLRPDRPGSWFLTRGGSLGVGFPGAVGMALARPEATVVGFAGDGGAMYTYQALWTAARYGIPAKFAVCNNGSYQILKDNLAAYRGGPGGSDERFPASFDLGDPSISFGELAQALGVPATPAGTAEEARSAADKAYDHAGPYLVDISTK